MMKEKLLEKFQDVYGDINGTKVYFEFTVNAPTSGEYELLARVQGTGESSINGLFNVSINGEEGTLNTSNDKILKGNQLKEQYNTSSDYLSWYNMFWWNMVNIGTYSLNKGENTIKITLPNGLSGNIDYFEIQNKMRPKERKKGSRPPYRACEIPNFSDCTVRNFVRSLQRKQ